jgi:hypothetical protein
VPASDADLAELQASDLRVGHLARAVLTLDHQGETRGGPKRTPGRHDLVLLEGPERQQRAAAVVEDRNLEHLFAPPRGEAECEPERRLAL